jgi:hypothetical protein
MGCGGWIRVDGPVSDGIVNNGVVQIGQVRLLSGGSDGGHGR